MPPLAEEEVSVLLRLLARLGMSEAAAPPSSGPIPMSVDPPASNPTVVSLPLPTSVASLSLPAVSAVFSPTVLSAAPHGHTPLTSTVLGTSTGVVYPQPSLSPPSVPGLQDAVAADGPSNPNAAGGIDWAKAKFPRVWAALDITANLFRWTALWTAFEVANPNWSSLAELELEVLLYDFTAAHLVAADEAEEELNNASRRSRRRRSKPPPSVSTRLCFVQQ